MNTRSTLRFLQPRVWHYCGHHNEHPIVLPVLVHPRSSVRAVRVPPQLLRFGPPPLESPLQGFDWLIAYRTATAVITFMVL